LTRAFGDWCLLRSGYWYWEIPWMASVYLGAKQNANVEKLAWTKHIFDAHLSGAWFLVWTDTCLFWVAKPIVHVEQGSFGRRLHCETGAACENDIENLYFLHGVLVPAYAVVCPDQISIQEIKDEGNEEVRRTLIEQFGWERFLRESGAKEKDRRFNERDGQWEKLYSLDDGSQRIVLVDPSTGRRYALGVPREINKCEQAQMWISHGLDRFAIHRS
jgi:hypothetical protein